MLVLALTSTIDYNSSGFSICKSCGKPIPKGEIRYIVDTVGTQGKRNLGFHHIECVLISHRKKLLPLILGSVIAEEDKKRLIEKLKETGYIKVLTKEELEKKELEEAIHDIHSKTNFKRARALITLTKNGHTLAERLITDILADLNEINLIKLAIYATGTLNLTEQIPRLLELYRSDMNVWPTIYRDRSVSLKDLMYSCSWVPVATEIKDDIIVTLVVMSPLPQEAITLVSEYYESNKNTSYLRDKLIFLNFFFKNNVKTAEKALLEELRDHLKEEWVNSPLEWKYSQDYLYLNELLTIIKTYHPAGFQNVIEDILTKPTAGIPWKIFLELIKVAFEYPTANVLLLLKKFEIDLKNLENYLLQSPVESEIPYFNVFVKTEIYPSLQKRIDELRTFRLELANMKEF